MRRPWFAIILCLIGLGLIIQANVAHAKLEDILYEKGQIIKGEWLKAKADSKKLGQFTVQCRPGNGSRAGISIQQGTGADRCLCLDETHGYCNGSLLHPRWATCPFSIAVELLTTVSVEGRQRAAPPSSVTSHEQAYCGS